MESFRAKFFSTQPVENPYKNYSILINSVKFNYTEDKGVTNAVAKDNENVKMTITPKGDINYADLCEGAKTEHGAPVDGKNLPMANANTFYSSEKDGIKTTVICVDDGGNGSIEVKYQYPTDNADYEKEFDPVDQYEITDKMIEILEETVNMRGKLTNTGVPGCCLYC